MNTLKTVSSCPENENDVRERVQRNMCQTFRPCRNSTLVYHCIRHDGDLVEVCAPKSLIIGNIKISLH